ncbi:hypothetical protein D3C80_731250 [compost metagenome]
MAWKNLELACLDIFLLDPAFTQCTDYIAHGGIVGREGRLGGLSLLQHGQGKDRHIGSDGGLPLA